MVSYLGVALGALNIVFLMPAILEADQIGLIRTILDAAFILATYSKFGIPASAVKFFPEFRHKKAYLGIFGMSLVLMVVGFLVVCGIVLLFQQPLMGSFQERSPEFNQHFFEVLLLAFLYTLVIGGMTYCNLLLKVSFQKFISEVVIRLGITTPLVLYYFDLISFGYVIPIIAGFYGLSFLLLLAYIAYLKQLYLRFSFSAFDKTVLKSMLIYAGFAFIGSGGGAIVSKIDTIMISSLKGLSDAGVYSIAFFMAAIVEMPKRSLISISSPLVARFFKEKDLKGIQDIYAKSSTNLLLIGGMVGILVWLNIDDIFLLIPNSKVYVGGKYVVLFIILAKVFDMGMGINNEIIANSWFYKWNVFIMPLFALVVVVSNLIFIPHFGLVGAAIASLFSVVFYNILRLIVVFIKMKMIPFSKSTIKSLIVLGLSFAAGYFQLYRIDLPLFDIFIRSAQIGILFFLGLIYIRPSQELFGIWTQLKNKFLS